jgi:hypothetical protein
MYYHNCWMVHKEYGVGLVSVIGGSFYLYRYPEDEAEASVPERITRLRGPSTLDAGQHGQCASRLNTESTITWRARLCTAKRTSCFF